MSTDALINRPVVVHCFEPRLANGERVWLSTEWSLLESHLSLFESRGGSVALVPSSFPFVAALGELPSSFVEGRLASMPVLRQLLEGRFELDLAASEGDSSLSRARAARIEAVLAPILDFALWAHLPCYQQHTRPAVLRSACFAARPFGIAFCQRKRRQALQALHDRPAHVILAELQQFLSEIDTQLNTRTSQINVAVRLDDVALYAHGRALLAVPAEQAPWNPDMHGLPALRQFVEEFDAMLAYEWAKDYGQYTSTLRWESAAVLDRLCSGAEAHAHGAPALDLKTAALGSAVQSSPADSASWQGGAGRASADVLPTRSSNTAFGDFWAGLRGRRAAEHKSSTSASASGDVCGASCASGGNSSSSRPEPMSRAEIRDNALFVAWLIVSTGALAVLSVKRAQSRPG